MRVFLVIDETHFYQPEFVADLLRRGKHEFVGAALVTKVSPKSNLELYMRRHWYYLRLMEILKLGLKKVWYGLKDRLGPSTRDSKFYSVRKVYDIFDIPYFEVEYKINKKEYLDRIASYQPDVIVSSNSMIFGKRLLALPRLGCINRHSALLPAYGGLWPVFQAVRCGEVEVGVTAHTMVPEIDKGEMLAQEVVKIESTDTIDTLYQKCFKVSADVVIDALDRIADSERTPLRNAYKPSYFSFPEKEHWSDLRKRGVRFI